MPEGLSPELKSIALNRSEKPDKTLRNDSKFRNALSALLVLLSLQGSVKPTEQNHQPPNPPAVQPFGEPPPETPLVSSPTEEPFVPNLPKVPESSSPTPIPPEQNKPHYQSVLEILQKKTEQIPLSHTYQVRETKVPGVVPFATDNPDLQVNLWKDKTGDGKFALSVAIPLEFFQPDNFDQFYLLDNKTLLPHTTFNRESINPLLKRLKKQGERSILICFNCEEVIGFNSGNLDILDSSAGYQSIMDLIKNGFTLTLARRGLPGPTEPAFYERRIILPGNPDVPLNQNSLPPPPFPKNSGISY